MKADRAKCAMKADRANANELNQLNKSDDEATFFSIQTEIKSLILPKHSHPFPVRTRSAGGGDKARSDPLGRMVPHPGEETTNHSKGKPESEWSTFLIQFRPHWGLVWQDY